MHPGQNGLTLIERRRIEAAMAARIYEAMSRELGKERALQIVGQAIDRAAMEDGRAFASIAPDGPRLEHFATILERLRDGGSLEISDESLESNLFRYNVNRCAYMELYSGMELPPELGATLSCRRDAAFAHGYSARLIMERPQYIGRGDPACIFKYTWKETDQS